MYFSTLTGGGGGRPDIYISNTLYIRAVHKGVLTVNIWSRSVALDALLDLYRYICCYHNLH